MLLDFIDKAGWTRVAASNTARSRAPRPTSCRILCRKMSRKRVPALHGAASRSPFAGRKVGKEMTVLIDEVDEEAPPRPLLRRRA